MLQLACTAMSQLADTGWLLGSAGLHCTLRQHLSTQTAKYPLFWRLNKLAPRDSLLTGARLSESFSSPARATAQTSKLQPHTHTHPPQQEAAKLGRPHNPRCGHSRFTPTELTDARFSIVHRRRDKQVLFSPDLRSLFLSCWQAGLTDGDWRPPSPAFKPSRRPPARRSGETNHQR